MKRVLVAVVLLGVLVAGLPATAEAGPRERQLAKQDCRLHKNEEPRIFRAEYGGLDRRAVRKCTRISLRTTKRDCEEDRSEKPADFREDYGAGRAGLNACIRDRL